MKPNIPQPRDLDHGWWNCEDCRENCHNSNIDRVEKGLYADCFGRFYTEEYIDDMRQFFEDKQDFERCAVIRDYLTKREVRINSGLEVQPNRFY